MALKIGNAPCSWGVEFPDSPENPRWQDVLAETAAAGYAGTELGPVGYIPESAGMLAERLELLGLRLTAGVIFQPFHAPEAWEGLRDNLLRTGRMVRPLGARNLVLIDSIEAGRAAWAGNSEGAPRLDRSQLDGLHGRLREAARIASGEFGLQACLHPHAGGCVEFPDEVELAMDAVDECLMGLCLDTGHSLYAGLDPVRLLRRYAARVRYVHIKDLDRGILARCVEGRVGFYDACNRGVFCRLGRGGVDFAAFRRELASAGYRGWCTVEQDRGPDSLGSPRDDAEANRRFLASPGWAG